MQPIKSLQAKLKQSPLVHDLLRQIQLAGLPLPNEEEYRFHPVRKWRFDLAYVEKKLAIEIDGGIFTRGRHGRVFGQIADAEKINEAQNMGWRVLRFTRLDIHGGTLTKHQIRRGCKYGTCSQCLQPALKKKHACPPKFNHKIKVRVDVEPTAIQTIREALIGEQTC